MTAWELLVGVVEGKNKSLDTANLRSAGCQIPLSLNRTLLFHSRNGNLALLLHD